MDQPTNPGPALLREWRTAEGLSQKDAAARLGVKQSVLSLRELGDRGVPLGDALILQAVSRGRVPATAWGHSEEEVAAALDAGNFPPPLGSVFTASDFTREVGHEPPGEVAPDVEEPSGPVLVRADFDQTTTGA